MNPDMMIMTALTVMWAALVGLLWIVWRLHQRVVDLEALHEPLAVADTADEQTWGAVEDFFRDTHTDMEVKPS